MKKNIVTFLLIGLSQLFVSSVYARYTPKNDFDLIMKRVQSDNIPVNYDSITTACISLMDETGAFIDINYNSREIAVWPPSDHLDRLIAMAYSYVLEESPLHDDAVLFSKLVKGLQYWYDTDPHSDNVWWWDIYVPQRLGVFLITMELGRDNVPNDLREKVLTRLQERDPTPTGYSGGNQVDVALHNLYRACLTENSELLLQSTKYIFESIKYISSGDGIRPDNSYQAHGNQLHIGGYSETQLYGQVPVISYLVGTEYQLPDDKVSLLGHFIRNTFIKCIRGEVMAYNAHGRGISRRDYLSRIERWNKIIRCWKDVDEENNEIYDSFLSNINGIKFILEDNVINTHYYMSDFMLHVRPEWTFATRFSSVRTSRNEYGNGENLKGYFISDGSTCMQVSGREYNNIMPLWDWTMIPGTTTPQIENPPLPKNEWGTKGFAEFSGGVSDSINGVASYSYYDDYNGVNTGAQKGWFCFDKAIICLGSKIRSSHNKIRTIIEQSWGENSFSVTSRKGTEKGISSISSESIKMVCHGNTAYYFLDDNRVVAQTETTTGNWHDINTSEEDKEVKGTVFKLYEDLKTDKYAYIIMPNVSDDDCPLYNELDYEVLANNDSLQVVYGKKENIWGMIFYTPCTFRNESVEIYAEQPCIVLAYNLCDNDVKLYISDPTQKYSQMSLLIRTSTTPDFERLIFAYDNYESEKGRTLVKQFIKGNSSGITYISKQPHQISNYTGTLSVYVMDGTFVGNVEMENGVINNHSLVSGCYIVRPQSSVDLSKGYKLIIK